MLSRRISFRAVIFSWILGQSCSWSHWRPYWRMEEEPSTRGRPLHSPIQTARPAGGRPRNQCQNARPDDRRRAAIRSPGEPSIEDLSKPVTEPIPWQQVRRT